MACCTALLTNFVENNQTFNETLLMHIWQIVKYNIIKLQSKNIKTINCQLISMLIYRGGASFLAVVYKDQMLPHILKEILHSENKIEENF